MPEAKLVLTDGKVELKKKDKQLLVRERKKLKDKVTATLSPQWFPPVEGLRNLHPFIIESSDLDAPISIYKGVKSCTKHPISNFVSCTRLSPTYKAYISKVSSVSIPNYIQDTLTDFILKSSMIEAMKALYKNHTWELVKLPNGKKAMGFKWVFTMKHNADDSIKRYNASLVVNGYI